MREFDRLVAALEAKAAEIDERDGACDNGIFLACCERDLVEAVIRAMAESEEGVISYAAARLLEDLKGEVA